MFLILSLPACLENVIRDGIKIVPLVLSKVSRNKREGVEMVKNVRQ